MTVRVNYCPVCGSEDIYETELSHGERYYCNSCGRDNPYNIELWYNTSMQEKDELRNRGE